MPKIGVSPALTPPSSISGKTGVVIDRFPDGERLALNRVDTATMTSVVSDYVRDHPVSGELRTENLHYFDLSLSGRPMGAWGRFPDAFSELERVGKLLFVPARHRYNGRGGGGRQRSIIVFLRTPAQFGGCEIACIYKDVRSIQLRHVRRDRRCGHRPRIRA